MFMDVLLIATGFSGALTLAWLGRLLVRLLRTPPGAVVYFAPGPGPIDALVRELAGAKREVLLMAETLACRPIAQALVDARLRHAQVEVLLDAADHPDSDLQFLVEQGLVPRLANEPSGLRGLVVVVDGKTVASSSVGPSAEWPAGQVLIVRGHADLVTSCRQQFAALRGPARAAAGMAAPLPEAARGEKPPSASKEPIAPATFPAPRAEAAQPLPPTAPTEDNLQHALAQLPSTGTLAESAGEVGPEDVLASIARGLSEENAADEDDAPISGPTVTRATAELFARLRREVASQEDDSSEKAA